MLLLFVVVGRKRLLKKRQDVLEEEFQNLCTPFKETEHEGRRLRTSSVLKVDVDKYLLGIFTHKNDCFYSLIKPFFFIY